MLFVPQELQMKPYLMFILYIFEFDRCFSFIV